jgi:hypothetical protein
VDKAKTVAVRIVHVHFAVTPTLIRRLQIYRHTFRFEFLVEFIYVFNHQEHNSACHSVAGKRRDMQPRAITRQAHVAWIGLRVIKAVGKGLLEPELLTIKLLGPGGAPGQPAAMPRDQAVVQAQRTGQPVPVAGVDGLWALPNGNLSSTPPTVQGAPPATPQPQAQVPQPPANRVMPGAADGPPAPQQPQPAPAGGPQPPQLQPLNAKGLTAQQQAQIDAVAGTGRMTVQQRMTAEQAFPTL